ncbi:MAG: phosphoserine transaminase [Methylobacteriaceae bacterium]|nr:phosphoserine transaminase [Methylobacteriaceae bacterium]
MTDPAGRTEPAARPRVPFFSSGPCAKRPGWSPAALADAALGRSHRAPAGKAKLKRAIDLTREVLQVPATHRIAIVPASDTGAVEMAMWSLLGARGVDVLAWETFGETWVTDAVKQLRLADLRVIKAPFGDLPDLSQADARARDVLFTWNGTTSGVRVPDARWIPDDRDGLTICDATSAAFAQPLDWPKLDVVTFSWQKALGGEAGHGMLVLSPRAVARLESYTPPWPLPKLFRMTKGGKLNEGLFAGDTINTPSLLCVEDWLDALGWAQAVGGLPALMARADANAALVTAWAERSGWAANLASRPEIASNTSVCLAMADPELLARGPETVAAVAKGIARTLEDKGVAFDIGAYRDAPPGLRIWCGATVERDDIAALLPWLDWAYAGETARLVARAA